MAQGGSLLSGRRTYEDFYRFWPNQKDNQFTEVLDNSQKYIASTTLKEPLPFHPVTGVRLLDEEPEVYVNRDWIGTGKVEAFTTPDSARRTRTRS